MDVYVVSKPEIPEEYGEEIVQLIEHELHDLFKERLSDKESLSRVRPHFDLIKMAAQLICFRMNQDSFSEILYEACEEDDSFSDDLLLVSEAIKSLDSIYHQMFRLIGHYIVLAEDLSEKLEDSSKAKSLDIASERVCNKVAKEIQEYTDENQELNQ